MSVRRILLPLDGSHLAEIAIPPAIYFAKAWGATLVLFHAVEQTAPQKIHGSGHHLGEEREAEAYLQRLGKDNFPADIPTEIHVHAAAVRDVAESISNHVAELNIDVILMCAHGKGNPRRWFLGNIAQQIIRRAGTPIFFLPASYSSGSDPFQISDVLLPMDGQPSHAEGIAWAEFAAQRSRAPIHLAMVVPNTGDLSGSQAATRTLLPTSTLALLDIQAQQGADLLSDQATLFQAKGLSASTELLRGDIVDQLAQFAQRTSSGLLVIGTHGHTGNEAFWNQSVAARLLSRIANPVFLIPIKTE
jgi:nucleotide-binding universal stress UspA family protein